MSEIPTRPPSDSRRYGNPTILERILTFFGYLFAIPLFFIAIKIVQEYERGVIFRLGRLVGARGPGLFFILPFVERMVKVDLRVVTLDVPRQDVITKDNVTVKVDAVVYFKVVDPEDAVVKIMDYFRATSLVAQTTLRSVLGQSELDELLSQREELNQKLQQIIDEATEPWGIKVTIVEVRDVGLPADMIRVMSQQAEAERTRRAKVIHAEGEYQAAERLSEAGLVMSAQPIALQLRYLQTLTEIAAENSSTVVFPFPMDIVETLMSLRRETGTAAPTPPRTVPERTVTEPGASPSGT